ncbi:hypothetical protein HQ545_03495 [Candidatus Woesearchaeota archaeon]|nr:hypothetical protein [Candidatus Woesearchaeota archaeon]
MGKFTNAVILTLGMAMNGCYASTAYEDENTDTGYLEPIAGSSEPDDLVETIEDVPEVETQEPDDLVDIVEEEIDIEPDCVEGEKTLNFTEYNTCNFDEECVYTGPEGTTGYAEGIERSIQVEQDSTGDVYIIEESGPRLLISNEDQPVCQGDYVVIDPAFTPDGQIALFKLAVSDQSRFRFEAWGRDAALEGVPSLAPGEHVTGSVSFFSTYSETESPWANNRHRIQETQCPDGSVGYLVDSNGDGEITDFESLFVLDAAADLCYEE